MKILLIIIIAIFIASAYLNKIFETKETEEELMKIMEEMNDKPVKRSL